MIGARDRVRCSSSTSHLAPLHHQEAFRTPGIIPDSASSRKQMRHRPKRRRNARPRPQRLQRLWARTWNFGLRFAFSIQDFFAISRYQEKCIGNYQTTLALGEPAALLVVAAEWHPQFLQ